MNKLRQSFRRKKDIYVPESSRPHQWQSDEESVRIGKCSFAVKYLGHVEVEESRGMHICEDAVKRLKTDRKFFKGFFTKAGKKAIRAVLWVSADGLRVVDDKTKDLILDQTIEKVSFCAPDRNFERAFSYICRDGTTRRWICHCFMAIKDSGERLSHAVGCAFAACLERKQKREKECGVTATFDANRTTFTREGSFRVTTATEAAEREEVMRQLQDKKAESEVNPSVPVSSGPSVGVVNQAVAPLTGPPSPSSSPPLGPQVIPRRHAPVEALARQGSFRGFPALNNKSSPFKRQLSLRMNELPSTVQRKSDFPLKNTVPELEGEGDSISSLCTQITSAFSGPPQDPFSQAPMPRPASSPQSPALPPGAQPDNQEMLACTTRNTSSLLSANMLASCPAVVNGSEPAVHPSAPPTLPPPLPARDTNPWAKTPPASSTPRGDWTTPVIVAPPSAKSSPSQQSHRRTPSEADRWLEEVTKAVRASQPEATPLSQNFLTPNPPAFSTPSTQAFSVPLSTQAFSVPSSTQAFSVPSSTQAFSVPSSTQAFSVPSSTQAFNVPSSTQAFSVPSSTQAFSVPSSTQAFSVPSSTQAFSVPSSTQAFSVPSSTQAFSVPSSTQAFSTTLPPPLPFHAPLQVASAAPMAFKHSVPLAVPTLPPRQPAYHAQAPACYPLSNGLSYAPPSVPVVGITPSQMVANVFGSATHPQAYPVPQHTMPFSHTPLQPANGSLAFNGAGADSWATPHMHASSAPPIPPQPLADPFEAKWAALESHTRPRTTPSPTNPFSSELHKTFEIQL
ncbi:hypothetical protein UPYG_G00227910 [Umbra pygmaea]|uniref:PID domain-containing protein n=1 Tax=Umbra pygmaea TaxID=75934 RepID=A0ABD0WCV0_UMBPY